MILKKNNLLINLLFYSSLFSVFLINSFVSYKIIYAYQIIVFFYLVYITESFKFKKIFYLNFFVLSIFFFTFSREYIYLILLCFVTSFINFKEKKKINLNYKKFILFLFLIFFLLSLRKFPENFNIYEFFTIMDDSKFYEFITYARWNFFNLNNNLASIFCLLVIAKLLNGSKHFFKYFSILGLIIILIMKSKSSLLFYIIVLSAYFFNLKRKILITFFLILNLFLVTFSLYLVNNYPNPYEDKGKLAQEKVFDNKVCKKISSKVILYFSECPGYKRIDGNPLDHSMLKIFGFSLYYKFYTYGLTINHIKNNISYYLYPSPIYYLKKEQKINDYIIGNHLAVHSFLLGIFVHLGILFGLLFLINLFYFINKNQIFLLLPFLISSTFLSFDIMLFFPLLLLNFFKCYKEDLIFKNQNKT